ncbi:MAG TPA: HlyD family efflux transporter periplasmic adaptor subunit [Patescibacteria group bacterium]|nr:HlyD family efflux transporter periplasmic adaptor subunit [Patescibacteria group bacterium]
MATFLTLLKSKKYYVIITIIVFLFIILRAILLTSPNTELTYTAKMENLIDTVQVSGTYSTASQIPVASPSNGVIDKIFVSNNSQVKKGDQLFHVQSTATVDQQKAAYAAYLAANSTVQADNATLYSLQSTMYAAWQAYINQATSATYQNSDGSPNATNRVETTFTVPQAAWLAAEANYKNQQAVINKDQAALSAAQQTYAETQSVTVIAPVGGTVVNLLAQSGDQVAANTSAITVIGTNTGQAAVSSSTPQSILIIANLSNPYLTADISEDYATRIVKGQKASVVFDAMKDKTFSATVENIDTVGTNTQGVITYKARIATDNLLSKIKPDMTALITIETLRKNNVIDVPNSAIVTRSNMSYVEQANTHKLIPVLVGARGVIKTEITSGLYAGTVLVANPNSN